MTTPTLRDAQDPIERAWRDLPAQLRAHPGIKALHRAALAQQAPEAVPVAWLCELMQEDGSVRTMIVTEDPDGLRFNDMGEPSPFKVTPLYAAPVAQQGTEPTPDHWSDCATNNAPAYKPGPCDCQPTPAMCRAAVVYVNGANVYERAPAEALAIEESIYAEVWKAMQAANPTAHAQQPAALTDASPSRADLLAAVQFYADREHLIWSEESAWDTVSGEPQNWWCDEAGTATVEDGTLARMTLEGRMTAQHFAALREGDDLDDGIPAATQAPATDTGEQQG